MTDEIDADFTGSVPELYERFLVPLIFEPYAADLTARLVALGSRSVLEVACGTGVVTRAMDAGLDEDVSIVATDLNQPMVDHAARSTAETCEIPAIAYCQGTPLRNEIEARDPARLGQTFTARRTARCRSRAASA